MDIVLGILADSYAIRWIRKGSSGLNQLFRGLIAGLFAIAAVVLFYMVFGVSG